MAQATQPFTIAALSVLKGRSTAIGLSDLITVEGSSYDLNVDSIDGSVLLDFRDSQSVAPALGSDCCRFATAAFQSIAPVPNEIVNKDTLAWSIVKLYYAAFYAGNSILRMLGESSSFLDRNHTNRISAMMTAMGSNPNFRMERGLYHCTLNPTASAVRYMKVGSSSGGSHEAFWRIFQNRIHSLSEGILLGSLIPAEAQQVFAKFRSLEMILNTSPQGVGGSLSSIRNELQYKHSFGVWFPVQLKKRERETLGRLAAQWQGDPMDIEPYRPGRDMFLNFVSACAFIVGLCRVIVARIAERSSEGDKCFICFGPLSFLRDAGLASASGVVR
ncbi:MAG: hypothetical protein H0V18_05900 [Pyrinomonadaceae bacterium]|nr:hypothetical protein [Pyrinomonadaceae bacterium]